VIRKDHVDVLTNVYLDVTTVLDNFIAIVVGHEPHFSLYFGIGGKISKEIPKTALLNSHGHTIIDLSSNEDLFAGIWAYI
jgi:hypothetical protein